MGAALQVRWQDGETKLAPTADNFPLQHLFRFNPIALFHLCVAFNEPFDDGLNGILVGGLHGGPLTIGRYPQITLKEARRRAAEARGLVVSRTSSAHCIEATSFRLAPVSMSNCTNGPNGRAIFAAPSQTSRISSSDNTRSRLVSAEGAVIPSQGDRSR